MKKIAFWKIIISVLCLMLTMAGILFINLGNYVKSRYEEYRFKKLLDIEVDFSKPGEYLGKIDHIWPGCKGLVILLEVPKKCSAKLTEEELDSLDFEWEIKDSDEELRVSRGMAQDSYMSRDLDGELWLSTFFYDLEEGNYDFHINVKSGLPQLSGVEQKLVIIYNPHVIDLAGYTFHMVLTNLGFGILIAGVILIVVVFISLRKKA